MIPTNIIIKLKVWQGKMFLIFLLTLLLCVLLNFLFLRPVLRMGLTGDDWQLLFAYKTYDPQPLNRILDVWMARGPYTTIQFYYIGLLDDLFGQNLALFQIINITFKVFASITLYLLISKIFKDQLLASTSSVIFSIIHSSAGALYYVVKGTEYLAIGFMNLFFIFYYQAVIKNSVKLTIFTTIILFITFMSSPIRLYPLYALILLIEIYLVIKNKNFSYLLRSLFRLTIFYLPIILFSVSRLGSSSGYLNGITDYFNGVKEGNWHYLLLPFKALGYSLFGNDQLRFLNFPAYLVGILIMIFSVVTFVIWVQRGSKLGKVFLLFFGPWFAFFFIMSTIAFLGAAFNILDSLHWYLIVPSLGISVFLAALVYTLFERGIKIKQLTYVICSFGLIITIAFISFYEIHEYFNFLLSIGTGAKDQVYMQNQILNSIDSQNQLNLILYLERPKDPETQIDSRFYAVALNSGHFGHWFFYFKKPQFLGCTIVVEDKNQLRQFFKVSEREYFEANSFCAETRYNIGTVKTIYEIGDFRAFLLKDKKMFNITDKVLNDLRSQ